MAATAPRKRTPRSAEHRAKISAALRGVPKSAEHRAKIGAGVRASWEARRRREALPESESEA